MLKLLGSKIRIFSPVILKASYLISLAALFVGVLAILPLPISYQFIYFGNFLLFTTAILHFGITLLGSIFGYSRSFPFSALGVLLILLFLFLKMPVIVTAICGFVGFILVFAGRKLHLDNRKGIQLGTHRSFFT